MLVVGQKSKAGHDPGRETRNVKMQSKFRGVTVALETIQDGLLQCSMKRDRVTSMTMSCTASAESGLISSKSAYSKPGPTKPPDHPLAVRIRERAGAAP